MSFGSGGGGAGSVAGSSDVALSGVVDGQALVYDTGVSKWQNGMPAMDSGLHRWETGSPAPSPVLPGTYWVVLNKSEAVPGWVPVGSLVTRYTDV